MINAVFFYRIARWFYLHKIPLIPKFITLFIFLVYNSKVPYTAIIGKGTKLGYGGIGVVIHSNTVMGENGMIGTNVTIGGRSGLQGVPVIGDRVDLGTGSKILGPIRIGNNVTVGANAVVIKDVPDNCIVAGVPSKIIRKLPLSIC